nr:hypothetical protein [Corynebacterium ulcerans]
MKHKLGERTYIRIDPAVPNGSLLMYLHGSRQSASVARNFTDRTFDHFAEHGTTVIYPEASHIIGTTHAVISQNRPDC